MFLEQSISFLFLPTWRSSAKNFKLLLLTNLFLKKFVNCNFHLVNPLEGRTRFFFYSTLRDLSSFQHSCREQNMYVCMLCSPAVPLCLCAGLKSILSQIRGCCLPSRCCHPLFVILWHSQGCMKMIFSGFTVFALLFKYPLLPPVCLPPLFRNMNLEETYTCRNKPSENS